MASRVRGAVLGALLAAGLWGSGCRDSGTGAESAGADAVTDAAALDASSNGDGAQVDGTSGVADAASPSDTGAGFDSTPDTAASAPDAVEATDATPDTASDVALADTTGSDATEPDTTEDTTITDATEDTTIADATEDTTVGDTTGDTTEDTTIGDTTEDIAEDTTEDTGSPIEEGPQWLLGGDCDPMVPTFCGYPFPSNVYLVTDETTVTGHHVAFGETTPPKSKTGVQAAPDIFYKTDGFSASATLLTHLPGATVTGLPDPNHIEDSLLPDCPTVVINADTGERVPHFAELDTWSNDDARRTFMIRPVVRLEDETRYIVAIRNVVDDSGTPLPPNDVFAALRDGTTSADISVERRHDLYEDIFTRLESAGVPRGDLQLAWDFTTASRENNTDGMLLMRDAALAEYGDTGAPYTIDTVEEDWSPEIARRIEGKITVPLYLDQPGPGGVMLLDDDGMPVQNGTAEYPFLVLIPKVAEVEPTRLLQYGHGLFGTRFSMESKDYQSLANTYGYTMFATDFYGMSQEDLPVIAGLVIGGDATDFKTVPDRSRQGFLLMLVLMRTMRTALADDPVMQIGPNPAYLKTDAYYFGGSQGGIYGATYMSLTTEIARGILAVPGQSYALMLPRSVHFDQFKLAIDVAYDDPLTTQYLLGLSQMLWDRAEPSGYGYAVAKDTFPGTDPHDVLVIECIGDHQVPNLSTELLVRSIGAAQVKPVNRTLFGIDQVDPPQTLSSFVDIDYGLPPVPVVNQPMRDGKDPHGKPVENAPIIQMVDEFLKTGTVQQFCSGPCDPE